MKPTRCAPPLWTRKHGTYTGPRLGQGSAVRMSESVSKERALIELSDVVKHFPVSRSLGEIVRGQRPAVRALDGVSLDIGAGDAVAVVGESGCGKTTLGRLMLKLTEPTTGTIAFDGAALGGRAGEELRAF